MFGRMAITVGISLVVTRLLLQTLGKVDFGLILALGATGAMLQFVTSALSSGMQRQLAYELARDGKDQLIRVFSTGWVVFLVLGTGLWLVGVALTPVIMHGLTIPAERAAASWWVYQISLLSLVLTVTATPYRALIMAHQHLTINAVADGITSLMRLAAVLLLLRTPWDLMVSFVAYQLAGLAAVRWGVNGYCLWRYEESWPRLKHFDRTQLKEISSIATWSFLSEMAWRMRMQGGILLLNIFFGPVVNAAYGIAVQIVGFVIQLMGAIRMAVLPAIVGAHVKGNQQNVHRLALVAGKYTLLLLSLLFVPILFELEQILHLWLGDYPPDTAILTRLSVVWALGSAMVLGYRLAQFATGNLGWYTRATLLVSAGLLIVSGTGFYYGLPPWFLPATACVGAVVLIEIAVRRIGAEIELPAAQWIREALLPTLGVLVPATAGAMLVRWSFAESLWRLVAVTAAYTIIAVPLIWWVALAAWERQRFLGIASSAMSVLQRATNARPEA